MTVEFARGIAARIWCDEVMDATDKDPGMASREMNTELCESIAQLLYNEYGDN